MEKYGGARQATDDNIVRRMRMVWRITKTTDTHSENAILTALLRQKWLRERASRSRYIYIACFVSYLMATGDYLPIGQAVEFDHLCPFGTEAKNAWSYTSPAPYASLRTVCTPCRSHVELPSKR